MAEMVELTNGKATVRFSDIGDPFSDGYDFRDFTVELEDAGLSARTAVRTILGQSCLTAFLAEVAESWRGWDGTKTWRSLEGDLHLRVEHDGVGAVTFEFEVRDSPYDDRWTASVCISLHAGQELIDFCAAVDGFLNSVS